MSAVEATYLGDCSPVSGEFRTQHTPEDRPAAARVESTSEVRARELPSGGYVIRRCEPRLRAWFQSSELVLYRVLALSPEAVWLGDERASGPPQGAGELWLEAAGERVGPISVTLESDPPEAWFAELDVRVERVAVLSGARGEKEGVARFIARLVALGIASAEEQPSPPPELVNDRAQVLDTLELFAREKIAGYVSTPEGKRALFVAKLDREHEQLSWEGDASLLTFPALVEFPYLHALYQVPVGARTGVGTTELPAWLARSMRRSHRRAPAPRGLTIQALHPREPFLHVLAQVHDISRGGASFEAGAEARLLYPGLALDVCRLSLGPQLSSSFRAVVRSVRPRSAEGCFVVGISFEPVNEEDRQVLVSFLEAALYPTTHTRAEDAWALHESSGYLTLSGKTPRDFARLREHFLSAQHKLDAAPDIATVAYWPARGRVEATVSHYRVYESTWLACQLSKRKAQDALPFSRQGIRDMYLRIYETAQADPDTRWLLTYVQDAAPTWSREIQVAVAARFQATGEGAIVPFRALEMDSATRTPHELYAASLSVSSDPRLVRAAIRDLNRVRPAQYLDALDLTETRADLARLKERWHDRGMARKRALFVACEGQTRVALSVLELAELGVHIYGLLDCLRMYPLRPGGERAFGMLLGQARTWFAREGRQHFVYLEEFASNVSRKKPGLRDLGGATLSLLSTTRVPELLERAADLASREPTRRTKPEPAP
jgi:hypothetical protein